MEYGLIGKKLGHSFSPFIHGMLGDYKYELIEVAEEELEEFFKKRDFKGINVTIPYKERIIPYLDHIDKNAEKIGAVNTVVNEDGVLWGYNTDFYGLVALIRRNDITIKDRKVIILGTGGTSLTAKAVAEGLGAREVLRVSREGRGEGIIGYEELQDEHLDANVLINTTPVGMYPNSYDAPVNIALFEVMDAVVDVIYNPLVPRLVYDARLTDMTAEGGLYMLVNQAVIASELFFTKGYPYGTADRIYKELRNKLENIILIGMPSCGKSSVGRRVAELLGREFLDTDAMVIQMAGKSIRDIFESDGEEVFRDYETAALKEALKHSSAVIATGGGVVTRAENMEEIQRGGRVYYIDRPLHDLLPTSDRPLSGSREHIKKLYEQRHGDYEYLADEVIDGEGSVEEVALRVLSVKEMFDEYLYH